MKPKTLVIADLDQAQEAMCQLKKLDRDIESTKLELDADVDMLKAKAKALLGPPTAQAKALENALSNFAHHHKAELFKKKKSRHTPFGVYGFRKSTKLKTLPKFTWAIVLEKLKDYGFTEAIRNKETVKKDVMLGWPEKGWPVWGPRLIAVMNFTSN